MMSDIGLKPRAFMSLNSLAFWNINQKIYKNISALSNKVNLTTFINYLMLSFDGFIEKVMRLYVICNLIHRLEEMFFPPFYLLGKAKVSINSCQIKKKHFPQEKVK